MPTITKICKSSSKSPPNAIVVWNIIWKYQIKITQSLQCQKWINPLPSEVAYSASVWHLELPKRAVKNTGRAWGHSCVRHVARTWDTTGPDECVCQRTSQSDIYGTTFQFVAGLTDTLVKEVSSLSLLNFVYCLLKKLFVKLDFMW